MRLKIIDNLCEFQLRWRCHSLFWHVIRYTRMHYVFYNVFGKKNDELKMTHTHTRKKKRRKEGKNNNNTRNKNLPNPTKIHKKMKIKNVWRIERECVFAKLLWALRCHCSIYLTLSSLLALAWMSWIWKIFHIEMSFDFYVLFVLWFSVRR